MRLCSNVPAQSIVQTALGGHQSVNDYIVPGGRIYEQREYITEALNSIPGMSAGSIVPKQVRQMGMTLGELYDIIIADTCRK